MDKKVIPCKWRVFKSSAVFTMGLQRPTEVEYEKTIEEKPGAVFLEFAPSKKTGKNEYNWDEKRLFKLDATDLAKIITEQEFNLIHNPLLNKPEDDGSKVQHLSFSILQNKTERSNTYGFLSISFAGGGKISIAMTYAEYTTFVKLCDSSLPIILGFE